jgi:hypothetical protein
VDYKPVGKGKSEIYIEFLNHLNSSVVDLLSDQPRMVVQFIQLERRTIRGGHETIDHPRGLHDDISNAVAGCIATVATVKPPLKISDRALELAGMPSRQAPLIGFANATYRGGW